MRESRVVSILILCSALLVLLQVLPTTSVSARSAVSTHQVESSAHTQQRSHGRSTEEASSISITIKAASAHHHHHEHAHHKKSGTCAPQNCKVNPDDTNVCGSDGKVYYNECLFQNAQCRNTALSKVTTWNGYHCPSTCTKPIVCKEIGKFLCGSDGNVYFGYCRLYSAQCVDAALQEIECPQGLIQIPPRRRQRQ